MILDLSQFQEEYFEIPFPNGENARVKKPTEKIFIDFIRLNKKLNEVEANGAAEENLNAINTMLLIILNNNADMKVYKEADLKWMTIDIKGYIIKKYSEFMSNLLSHPN